MKTKQTDKEKTQIFSSVKDGALANCVLLGFEILFLVS